MRWGLDFEEIIISELLKLAAASSQDNPCPSCCMYCRRRATTNDNSARVPGLAGLDSRLLSHLS